MPALYKRLMPIVAPLRALLTVVVLMGLNGWDAAAEPVPLPRPRPPTWVEPLTFREAAGPDFDTANVTAKPTLCDESLGKIADFTLAPWLIGPGQCGGRDMVALEAVWLANGGRVEVQPAPVLTCAMAQTFSGWVRNDAAPRVAALGSQLHAIENYDGYECRTRNRVIGAKPSNHGNGIAIDVRSFTLADGRVLGLADITVSKELRASLRASACEKFTTVLGPGEAYHGSHIHLDIKQRWHGYRICQWDVRVPPPASAAESGEGPLVTVPLPPPRPLEAR